MNIQKSMYQRWKSGEISWIEYNNYCTRRRGYSDINEYNRERTHITGICKPRKKLEERFWEKVNIKGEDECWEWKAYINIGGYGTFNFENKVETLAHRVAYEITKGKIEKGKIVMHTCDNRLCVNPKHLRLGTHQDNMDDMVKKGRSFKRDMNGENNYNAKLTERDIREICLLYSSEKFTQQEIAEKIGVTQGNISLIVNNKNWKYVITSPVEVVNKSNNA